MSLARESDTIAAIATPAGEGGICVVRISGENAVGVADLGFRGKFPLGHALSHTAHYGSFVDEEGRAIDNVVALVFRKPHSYTGEDTVELSCHGGQFLTKRILEEVIRFGARAAGPGEFTKRAFLNGRLDLVQAEAVADLIRARSERAHQSSLNQLEGHLSRKLAAIKEQLVESIGLLELELDFAEEGYEFADKEKVASQIQDLVSQVSKLLSTYRVGRVFRNGVSVALVGSPNVGKSSLLNALLQQERAIVTSIPGTTRDVIEESITLDGVLFSLGDTAGLRETDDPIEKEGVKRAEDKLQKSDVIVLLLDNSRALQPGEAILVGRLVEVVEARGVKCVVALNKIDLAPIDEARFTEIKDLLSRHRVVGVSAKTLVGLDALKDALVSAAISDGENIADSSVMITNMRHFSALERAKTSLLLALETLKAGKTGEFVAVDLRAALDSVGEIVGTVTTEDILNSIFSKFCIGK